jgi:hypothetical protein
VLITWKGTPDWNSATSVSDDGTLVTFDSRNARLTPGDRHGYIDSFVAVHAEKRNEPVSVALPLGSLRVSHTDRYFPELRKGKRAKRPIYLRNVGQLPLTVEILPPPAPFHLSSPTSVRLRPGQRKAIWVAFKAKSVGYFYEGLVVKPLELGTPTALVRLWCVVGPVR